MNRQRRTFLMLSAALTLAPFSTTAATAASDAERLAARVGKDVTRLRDGGDAAREIMRRALDFGRVRAETVNEHASVARTGVASRFQMEQGGGLLQQQERGRNIPGGYLGGDIDLRFNFELWQYAYAVVRPGADGRPVRSLHFFDPAGSAIHSLAPQSDIAAGLFDMLLADMRHAEQRPGLTIVPPAPPAGADRQDKQDSQAPGLPPEDAVQEVQGAALRQLLAGAAQRQLTVTVTLGNGGVTQLATVRLKDYAAEGAWLAVSDADFTLRLRGDAVHRAWIVRRSGLLSVECYDRDERLIVTLIGARERGRPQEPGWTAALQGLPLVR